MSSDNMDLDLDDEFTEEVSAGKPTLKDMWDNNPFLKIGAVVVGVIIIGFVYMTVFGGGETNDPDDVTVLRVNPNAQGQVGEEISEEYRKAVEDTNVKRAEIAKQIGGSALPTPIGQAKGQLDVSRSEEEENVGTDPLQEWRRTAEARRFEIDFSEDPTAAPAPVPEITPIIEPIRPQTEVVQDPELVSKLVQQMQMIIASKAPESAELKKVTVMPEEYVKVLKEREAMEQNMALPGGGSSFDSAGMETAGTGDLASEDPVIISMGQVIYAQLLNELNSDVPTPVLAHVLSGPLRGGRALGEFEVQDEYLVITFDYIVKDDITYTIDAIALDPETTLGGMKSHVDKHYWTRVILPAASRFISGFAEAATQTETTAVADGGGGAIQSTEDLNTREELMSGVKEAADGVVEILDEGVDRPITVHLHQGTPMGLLLLETIRESNAER